MRKNIKNIPVGFIEKYYFFFLAVIFIVAFFNIFYNLDVFPINSWDEARHGASAYEMLKNNNLIVNTYSYENDYWNLKPPLSFWLISLGYSLAGFNSLGLRLFSAVAAFLTIVITAFFSKYLFGKTASLISASVLATTTQYILSHSARSGDADSLHVLFFTLAVVSVSLTGLNKRWLYLSGLSFSLSFLTKSWHAMSIPVIIGLYLLISKSFLKIKLKEWLLFAFSSASPIMIWGIFRYMNDGLTFFKMMISLDLLSRTSNSLEGHTGAPSYYLSTLQYGYFYWLLILAGSFVFYLAIAYYNHDRSPKNYVLLMLLWIGVPLIIYSAAKTKITWYLLPAFPALAICIGTLCSRILKGTGRYVLIQLIVIFFLMFSIYKNEKVILTDIMSPQPDNIQADIELMRNLDGYNGSRIYTLCGDAEFPGCWRQCDLLAAELYVDLKPKDGGLKSFFEDESNALLMVPKDQYTDIMKSRNLKILFSGNISYILTKTATHVSEDSFLTRNLWE